MPHEDDTLARKTNEYRMYEEDHRVVWHFLNGSRLLNRAFVFVHTGNIGQVCLYDFIGFIQ